MGWRWQGRDSRLESSSDGEIFDEENKEENVKTEEEEKDQAVKNKEENVKTKKGEKDQAVKNFCEIKLKKVTNKLRVQLEKLIKMRAAAEEAQERAEKADSQWIFVSLKNLWFLSTALLSGALVVCMVCGHPSPIRHLVNLIVPSSL